MRGACTKTIITLSPSMLSIVNKTKMEQDGSSRLKTP